MLWDCNVCRSNLRNNYTLTDPYSLFGAGRADNMRICSVAATGAIREPVTASKLQPRPPQKCCVGLRVRCVDRSDRGAATTTWETKANL